MGSRKEIQKSISFLQDSFGSYYKSSQITLPDRFSRREFAFVFFEGKGMLRHLSFHRKNEVQSFLTKKSPAHAYYSTAFYSIPDAPTMNEKKWMGAELIFDLDADHLPNVEEIPYEKQLELVKKEFIKLVEDFLLKDFGFEEKNLELYFSGGRGYHCHVNDPRVYHLNSGERREIVDYIIGTNIDEKLVFHEQPMGRLEIKGKTYPKGRTLKMPSPDEPGWKGRISRGLIDIIDEIISNDEPIEQLKKYGVSEHTAEKLLEDLSEERLQRIKQGQLDQSPTIRRFFLNRALRKTAVSFAAGETDEPVTCDVKRLIRLPNSLHGKTGLKVTPVSLDGLKTFNPLRDTIVFSDEPILINLSKSHRIKMNEELFNLEEGEQIVPKYLAIFLLGKRIALLA